MVETPQGFFYDGRRTSVKRVSTTCLKKRTKDSNPLVTFDMCCDHSSSFFKALFINVFLF